MKDRNKAIPASYIFFEKDGKYLIARRANTGYYDGMYQVPAGHVDAGELPTEAAVREGKEEVGVTINPKDLELFHVSYRPKHDDTDNRVDFFFRISKWKGEIVNAEPHKCDDLRWVSLDKLPKNMTLHVKEAFKALKKDAFYKEIDLELLKKNGLYTLA
jgi:8-oxo-dGTP diphosphatase